MKNYLTRFFGKVSFVALSSFVLFSVMLNAQTETVDIRTIIEDGGSSTLDTVVTVQGRIDRYKDRVGGSGSPYYYIRDELGDEIMVQVALASQLPVVGGEYSVTGTVKNDKDGAGFAGMGGELYLWEASKIRLDVSNLCIHGLVASTCEICNKPPFWDQYGLYVLIGGGVLLMMMFTMIMILAFRRSEPQQVVYPEPMPQQGPAGSPHADVTQPIAPPQDVEESTVVIDRHGSVSVNQNSTVTIWNASFEILSGFGRSGESIPLFSVRDSITLGRKHSGSEAKSDFIGFEDPISGLSRAQNRIRRVVNGGSARFVLGYPEKRPPNWTLVNGKELAFESEHELQEGDTLQLPAGTPIQVRFQRGA